jgi:UDP-glucuronate 4-epimerase
MKILITGVTGFIGFHVANKLIKSEFDLVGIDNVNSYYDKELKLSRLSLLKTRGLRFLKLDITDKYVMENLFNKENFDVIIHLAAQAGVRYSIKKPHAYIDSNIIGFLNILEGARQNNIKHLIYASSSSVYGHNQKTPFSEDDTTDEPVSFYAASKKSNEMMAYSYSRLYNIPCTGLRFFTVYGPWGRPDMAYFKFVKQILNKETINIFGQGNMARDFTYIDDVVTALVSLIPIIPKINFKKKKFAPHEIFNIGNNKSEKLEKFIYIIERELNKKAIRNYIEMQPGDVINTWADTKKINEILKFSPRISIEEGLPLFIKWYKNHYKLL